MCKGCSAYNKRNNKQKHFLSRRHNLLLGLHTRILDTRNNLPLPADFREQFKDGVYITQGFDRNVMLLTRSAFDKVYQRVIAANLADPLARMLSRMILGTAHEAEIAFDGEVPIPTTLKDFASLAQDVVLVGLGDYVEVWSPELWIKQEEQLLDAEANTSKFSSLVVTTR